MSICVKTLSYNYNNIKYHNRETKDSSVYWKQQTS